MLATATAGIGDLVGLANKLLPQSSGRVEVVTGDPYTTQQIVEEILAVYQESKDQSRAFAPYLKGQTDYETGHNVHRFIRETIRYERDPALHQWIPTPSATWAKRVADCKGMSLLAASLLHSLDVPFAFRFIAEPPSTQLSHVYIVVNTQKGPVALDACLPQYGQEAYHTTRKDYHSTTMPIARISGVYGPQCLSAQPVEVLAQQRTQALQKGDLNAVFLLDDAIQAKQSASGGSATPWAETVPMWEHEYIETQLAGIGVAPALLAVASTPIPPLSQSLSDPSGPVKPEQAAQGASLIGQAAAFLLPLIPKLIAKIPIFGGLLGKLVRGPEIDPQIPIGAGTVASYYAMLQSVNDPRAPGFWDYVLARRGGEPTVHQQSYNSGLWQYRNYPAVKAAALEFWNKRLGSDPVTFFATWYASEDPNPHRVGREAYAQGEFAKDKHKRPIGWHRLVTAAWDLSPSSQQSIYQTVTRIAQATQYMLSQGLDPRFFSLEQIDQNYSPDQVPALFGPQLLQSAGAKPGETMTQTIARFTAEQIAQLPPQVQSLVMGVQQQIVAAGGQTANRAANQSPVDYNPTPSPSSSSNTGTLLGAAAAAFLLLGKI